MGKLEISLLIPTMNRPQTLKTTLNGYYSKDFYPAEVIVVDQSESASVREEVKKITESFSKKAACVYIYQAEPYLTKARNTAFNAATYDFIICSDDDVEVNDDTVKNVYDILSRGDVSMIAGIDENAPEKSGKIGYVLGTKSFFKRKRGHVTESMLGRYPDKILKETPTEWAMGYFFAIKKSFAERQNIRWDENLVSYAYAEDLDYSFIYYEKSKAEGLKCILTPLVKVKHLVSREFRTPSFKSTVMYTVHRRYLAYKHKTGLFSRFMVNYCNFFRLLERKLKKQSPEDFKKAIKIAKSIKKQDYLNGNFKNLWKNLNV